MWVARSSNGAASFAARERQTPTSFDYRVAARTDSGFFLGDYLGLEHTTTGTFTPVFSVARSTQNPSDIVSTRVSGTTGGAPPAGGPSPGFSTNVLFGATTLFKSRFYIDEYEIG